MMLTQGPLADIIRAFAHHAEIPQGITFDADSNHKLQQANQAYLEITDEGVESDMLAHPVRKYAMKVTSKWLPAKCAVKIIEGDPVGISATFTMRDAQKMCIAFSMYPEECKECYDRLTAQGIKFESKLKARAVISLDGSQFNAA